MATFYCAAEMSVGPGVVAVMTIEASEGEETVEFPVFNVAAVSVLGGGGR